MKAEALKASDRERESSPVVVRVLSVLELLIGSSAAAD